MNLKQIIKEEVRRALTAHSNKGRKTSTSVYAARVNESYGSDFDGPGLVVTGRTPLDNENIKDVIEDHSYMGIWNSREGYWFFPEEPETLDALEDELTKSFNTYGIDARFESQE